MVARFIVSHRLAGKSSVARAASLDAHETVRSQIRSFASVVADTPRSGGARRLMVIEAIIEPEVYRKPARFEISAFAPRQPSSAGSGAAFGATVRSPRGPSVKRHRSGDFFESADRIHHYRQRTHGVFAAV